MAYITAEEYMSYTGETMTPGVFALAEARARKMVDYYTFNRITDPADYGEDLKLLMCELINADKETYTGAEAASWSNDGVSVTFDDRALSFSDDAGNKRQLIREYLPRHLFYRGVEPKEAGECDGKE